MLTPQLEALLTDLSEREENLQPEEASLLEELEVLTMDHCTLTPTPTTAEAEVSLLWLP
jgi:hypothetical protein